MYNSRKIQSFESAIEYLTERFQENVFKFNLQAEYSLNRYTTKDKLMEVINQNVKALELTKLFQSNHICGECWASSIMPISKFLEIREVFEVFPEYIKKTLAFPNYQFEIDCCTTGCATKIRSLLK